MPYKGISQQQCPVGSPEFEIGLKGVYQSPCITQQMWQIQVMASNITLIYLEALMKSVSMATPWPNPWRAHQMPLEYTGNHINTAHVLAFLQEAMAMGQAVYSQGQQQQPGGQEGAPGGPGGAAPGDNVVDADFKDSDDKSSSS